MNTPFRSLALLLALCLSLPAMALDLPGAAPHVLICGGLHFAGEVLALSPETWPN